MSHFEAKNASNLISVAPLEELTALLQTPSIFEESYF